MPSGLIQSAFGSLLTQYSAVGVHQTGEIGADTFQAYFEDKVAAVRASTESAPSPLLVPGPPGVSLLAFDPVDCREVADVIRQLPDKCCAADPLPTSVLKQLYS